MPPVSSCVLGLGQLFFVTQPVVKCAAVPATSAGASAGGRAQRRKMREEEEEEEEEEWVVVVVVVVVVVGRKRQIKTRAWLDGDRDAFPINCAQAPAVAPD